MTGRETETLQETLLALLRSQEREKQLRDEYSAILAGMSAMAGANNKRQVFNSLLAVLRKYIGFEHALVLTREDETSQLEELVTTCVHFEGCQWEVSQTFIRAMNGESIALFDPARVAEFRKLPDDRIQLCRSVLMTGVKVSSGDALLLFIHSKPGQFGASCKRVLSRFRPLLERAIIDIDYRERLQTLVTVRTQELLHSQQRFKDFANTVGDWFWEIDTEFRFTYISAPDLSNHVIDKKSLLDLFDGEKDFQTKLRNKLLKNEDFEDLEWQLPGNEGGAWISFSASPYFSKHGELRGYRGTAKDITSKKQRLVELQQARQQAESANAAKSQFLAMMSHEIRTPLNAVLGLMDTLADSGLNFEQLKWINQMEQSAQLLLTIINDILDLSRIESGKFDLYLEPMSVVDCVNLVVEQLEDQAIKKNISLSVSIDDFVPKQMLGDKNRVTQVMFNLIGNAIKFTDQGSVRVTVSKEGEDLTVKVIDTGIGISAEAQKNLFNPFVQADGSITRKYGGTGLGLAISRHLLEKMEGRISLQSTLGQGSCFTIHLPIKETEVREEKSVYQPSKALRRPLKILLAEDSQTNQMVAKLMLEKRGHHVEVADNGQIALDMVSASPECFDLILMDISMPVMDGMEATRKIRENHVKLPIIALTANAMHSDQVEYSKVGMDGFLAKPIRVPELDKMLSMYAELI
ncbi:ATP-binding protein [Photobacterium sp. 1_MG-2023]|uniref:ATP-binding protein n=1 Tax=Photobacterium sp. 1_MG-2023 TaxID=3062646 RepID=UPI0026E2126D|nr:ATP-binding protein [Photobacterium sp. 1_MG-2023]MDO6705338.1 ATP-binding protein [Photobacterium sp. 1_MG-2023]